MREYRSALRTEQPIQKAARLIGEGRVTLLEGAKVYEVQGDHGSYRVIASMQGIWCPCPASSSLCAHVLAVAQVRLREREWPGGLLEGDFEDEYEVAS